MSEEILDLDALLPPPRKIRLQGKILEVKPLTIRQLIYIVKLEQRLAEVNNEDELMEEVRKALVPFIPALAEDETIDFTAGQMRELIKFAQKISVEVADDKETKVYAEPKKKVDSQEGLPTSSDSTPPTQ